MTGDATPKQHPGPTTTAPLPVGRGAAWNG